MIARVLIATQAQQLDRVFDYAVPDCMTEILKIGARVLVPFQNRPNLGYVWELAEKSDFQNLKSVLELIDDEPLLTVTQYQLVNQLSEYYLCSRVDVIKACFPPGGNITKKRFYQLQAGIDSIEAALQSIFNESTVKETLSLLALGAKAKWTCEGWRKKFHKLPKVWQFLLQRRYLVQTNELADPKVEPKQFRLYRLTNSDSYLTETAAAKRIQAILSCKEQGLTRSELCATAEVSSSVVDRLLKEAKLVCHTISQERLSEEMATVQPLRPISLNEAQQHAVKYILDPQTPSCCLLHGITGSGKTEVYFEAAAHYLDLGYQVLYLVPEIALTPQTLERAKRRFGNDVALLHSNMSDGERYDQWYRVKRGVGRLVLGARSAVFAPLSNLGLIIVDEEHESSYKQEDVPRYHIRWVVEKLAEITGAKVVLGSATPSVESFYRSQEGDFGYFHLQQRFNRNQLPEVTLVDMREELKAGNKNVLSLNLQQAIAETLTKNEQVILFLNRRGYATFVLCRDCGQALRCPSCEVSLTYHQSDNFLRCHYCDYRMAVPEICPNCKSTRIRYFGHGTQKLEEELNTCYPEANIIRMDVDTTARKGAHYQIYKQLTTGSVDILLGTQMIAKGLDLPRVTLVGVISADSTLNLPDFRAAERTFQLLTQVAGRAGRGNTLGKVIFQSYQLEHYSLQNAQHHDYVSFYQQEIAFRRELRFPPFSELIKIAFSGLNEASVIQAATEYQQLFDQQIVLADHHDPETFAEVLGPAPALIPKIQDNYRWQLLIKSNQPAWLEHILKEAGAKFNPRKYPDIRITRDRNPFSVI